MSIRNNTYAAVPSPDTAAPHLTTDQATAAQVVRGALSTTGRSHADIAAAAGVARSKASGWALGLTAISALHLVRIAQTDRVLFRALIKELADLAPEQIHAPLPPRERLCCLFQEMGNVAGEVNSALADGQIDDSERARIKREIARARKALDQLEHDCR